VREFLYSRNAVYEALRARRRQFFQLLIAEGAQDKGKLADIAQLAGQRKIPVQRVPRARLDKIHADNQGVALEAGGYPYAGLEDMLARADEHGEKPFILLLDTLNDPQNFGTLLRTAEAVGIHGVIIPLARTVEVTPAAVNASSGASEHLLIGRANLVQAIEELKAADVWIAGLDQAGDPTPLRLPPNVDIWGESKRGVAPGRSPLQGALALVVGSEGEGMRPLVKKSCDFILRLPMRGQIESLNAAVAGSVGLYLAYLTRDQL
jgi:23S rRNA (guanosine2251-2'-O)-methyltransferase